MELSAEDYARIVRSLSDADSSASGHELRRAPRIAQRGRMTIILCDATGAARTPIKIRLHNVSSRGMGFLHNQPLPEGEQFVARLPRSGDEPVHILCAVAHCRPVSKELFFIGAEFTCATSPLVTRQDEGTGQAQRIRQAILD